LHATAQNDQSEAALLLLSRGRAPTNVRNAMGTLDGAGKQQLDGALFGDKPLFEQKVWET